MIAYIQISKSITKNAKQQSFQRLYRNCFPYIHQSPLNPASLHKLYKGGYIVGAILFIGYLEQSTYKHLIDAANQQHLSFYLNSKKSIKSINCYPAIAVIPFNVPIKSTQKGQISALKVNEILLKRLHDKMGKRTLKMFKFLVNEFEVSKNKILSHRIVTLRKEHAINLMMGIKSAEFRINRFGDKMLAKIKSNKDLKKLLLRKRKPNAKGVSKLSKFCVKI